MLRIKRAYEQSSPDDGYRVLVDRLWPRGVKKESAAIDVWAKELAPSDGLRQWYGHEPEKFPEFAGRYREELSNDEARARLRELAKRAAKETVTLVFGAKDEEHSNAAVLREFLSKKRASPHRRRASAPKRTRTAKR